MSKSDKPLYVVKAGPAEPFETVRPDPGGSQFVDVMFNLGESTSDGNDGQRLDADQAAVILTQDVEACWPLPPINEILGVVYEKSKVPTIPQLYAVRGNGRVIGYLAMARDDHKTEVDKGRLFWELTKYLGLATEDERGLRTTGTPGDWGWAFDDEAETLPLGAVIFEAGYGPPLPVKAINHALWSLSTQARWPKRPLQRLFTYPYNRGEGELTSGVMLLPLVDGIGENKLVDDVFVEGIMGRNVNTSSILQYPVQLHPRRFQ